jgi:hypothetical protein
MLAFDMTVKRSAVVVTCLGLGLICLLLLWVVRPAPRMRRGGLGVTFAGLTNDASGATLAQFKVANGFPRRVRFGVGEVQIRDTNGWPNWMRVAGGTNWLVVAAGSNLVFSVPAPAMEGVTWRVPLTYQEDLPWGDEVRDRIKGIGYGIAHWRPGRPSYRMGVRRSAFVDGPEMVGLTNQPAQRIGEAGGPAQDANRAPGAAAEE